MRRSRRAPAVPLEISKGAEAAAAAATAAAATVALPLCYVRGAWHVIGPPCAADVTLIDLIPSMFLG